MSESIANLHVQLRASADKIASDINRDMRAQQGAIQAQAVAMGTLIAVGIAAGVKAIAGTIRAAVSMGLEGLDRIDALDEAATKIGATYNGLQDLKYAAESTGSSFEAMVGALGKMQGNISSGAANDALTRIRLDAQSLRGMKPEAQFAEIANQLSRVKNTGDKIDLTKQIFGRGGVDILNVINQGKTGLSEMSAIVQTMGGHLSDAQRAMVGMTNDNLDKMKAGWGFVKDQIAVGIAPVIVGIAEEMEKLGPLATRAGAAIGAWAADLYKSQGGIQGILQSAVDIAAKIADWSVPFLIFKKLVETGFRAITTAVTALGNVLGTGFAQGQAAFKVLAELVKIGVQSMKNDWIDLGYQIELAFTRALNKIKEGIKSVADTMSPVLKALNPGKAGFDAARSNAIRKARDQYAPGQALPQGMEPDLPSGPGGIDSSLLDLSPEPTRPETKPLDWAGLTSAKEEFRVVNEEAMRADAEAAKQAAKEIADASNEAYEALSDPFSGGPSPGDIIKADFEKANRAAEESRNKNKAANMADAANTAALHEVASAADLERTKKKYDAIDKMVKRDAEERRRALETIQRADENSAEQFKSLNRDMVGDIVTSWATGTGKISDIVSQWANQMIKQFISLSLFGNMKSGGSIAGLFGGASSGGGWAQALGTLVGGFFAEGGRPPMGKVSVVGEKGPELFVPDSAGRVIPNHKAASFVGSGGGGGGGGGGGQPPIVISQSFATGVTRAELAGSMDEVIDRTTEAVAAAVGRGGGYRKRLQS